ncbi:DUF4242 domain-containing protein [Synechococcus elongatus IITB4]|uniref:DUF4242 domain-containing protein n=1 Tax=Synechococcus elongatus TaxID=32046 RepID=UPI0030D0FAE0
MPLYLVEATLPEVAPEIVQTQLNELAAAASQQQAVLIEAQVARSDRKIFVIVEADSEAVAQAAVEPSPWAIAAIKQVRLIGQDPRINPDRKTEANYLVEWDLPAGLTMETYLQRKAEKTPLYAQVPEVQFERTYVCEDLSKCLCFYDGPDEAAVRRAREVVGAPIDRLAAIETIG